MILCKEVFRPGVPSTTWLNVQASHRLAWAALVAFGMCVLLTLILYRFRGSRRGHCLTGAGALLMVFHPVWTVSAGIGDCGESKRFLSWVVLGVIGALAIGHLVLMLWPNANRDADIVDDYDDRRLWEP